MLQNNSFYILLCLEISTSFDKPFTVFVQQLHHLQHHITRPTAQSVMFVACTYETDVVQTAGKKRVVEYTVARQLTGSGKTNTFCSVYW